MSSTLSDTYLLTMRRISTRETVLLVFRNMFFHLVTLPLETRV